MQRWAYVVELVKRVLRREDQRMIDCYWYFVKKTDVVHVALRQVEGTVLSKELADQVCERLKADQQTAATYHTIKALEQSIDDDTPVFTELHQVGLAPVPPPPAPTAVAELRRVIEKCFDQGMTQQEIAIEAMKAVIGYDTAKGALRWLSNPMQKKEF